MGKEYIEKEGKEERGIAKGLFLGNIHEDLLFPFPTYSASEKETLEMVLESVDRFLEGKAEEHVAHDRKGEQPKEYLNALKELGLFGLIIPEEFGGIGLSNKGYSRVLQQTSRYGASTSLTIGAHSSIGMKGLLLFGNPEQKAKYLPKLASGEWIAAFCLTEAGSGSDAASIKTHGVKQADGSYIVTGEKIWITNGPLADFFTVFAKTEGDAGKMTAFIVEKSFPGVSSGPKEDKMGIRGSATSTITLNKVHVPKENILGGEGKGFKVAMDILNNGRTGLGGGCVGASKRLLNAAIKQAADRKQFGVSIDSFGLVQEKIAQVSTICFAAESVVTVVGGLIDSGSGEYSIEAAMSKIYASEALWTTAFETLQIAGGNGFMREYPYEQVTRDSRINLIFEGTNEILRLYVGLTALKDVGAELKSVASVGKFLDDPIKGFGVLSKFATRKFSKISSLGRDKLDVHESLRDISAVYELYVPRLAEASNQLILRYKKAVKDEQHQVKRLSDIAIDLFVGLCTLSRVDSLLKTGKINVDSDQVKFLTLFTEQAKRRMQTNLKRLISNDDALMTDIAKSISGKGKYDFDTI